MARDFWLQALTAQPVTLLVSFTGVHPRSRESTAVVETFWRRTLRPSRRGVVQNRGPATNFTGSSVGRERESGNAERFQRRCLMFDNRWGDDPLDRVGPSRRVHGARQPAPRPRTRARPRLRPRLFWRLSRSVRRGTSKPVTSSLGDMRPTRSDSMARTACCCRLTSITLRRGLHHLLEQPATGHRSGGSRHAARRVGR